MSQRGGRGGKGGWTPERSVAGKRNPWLVVGVISIATFMVVLDSSIANVALAHIAGSLSASYDEATWVVTSFLVANAVIIPISGWLADVIGRKRFYMISVALFTVSSFLCGLAPSLGFLVVARVMQGIGGGGLTPVEQSMLVDTFPPEKRGLAFAAYGVVVIVGPILGPTLGGWITDNFSWNWVFFINIPVGILSLALTTFFVDEPEAIREQRDKILQGGLRVDYPGFAFEALFLGCLEVTLDRGQRDDWFSSPTIVICAVVAVLALLALIPWELTRDNPIIRINMLGRRNFAISSMLMLVMGMVIFSSTQFIPQLLQEVMGYTATDAGLALTLGGVATFLVMPLSGILSNRMDLRILIGGAFLLQGFALWHMSHLNAQMSFWDAAVARLYQSIGLPFLFVPITNIAYVGLKPEESNQASALLNMSRNLGGTIGIAAVQTMLQRREQMHQARYAETLNPLNPNYQQGIHHITNALMAQGYSHLQATRAAVAVLYRQLLQQSAMLSYVETFHLLMIVVLCAVPLVLLLHKQSAGAEGAAP
ncbi:MAG TPA: DHA2 family efflux MFS transporter permease subunit [Rhizomicrobium sp.]|jgi:DHA2 family multidrug resistance protein|nr:DHA2 family efflux MFS transporter permease subunit [Rhizomicrobium sp.]